MTNIINYLLVKISFWDQLKQEAKEIWDLVVDFFIMIKEMTYDVLANAIGGDMALLLVVMVGVIGSMLIFLTLINK